MKQIKAIVAILLCLMTLVCLFGCSDGDTVIECEGKDISRDEYRYFYMNYKLADPDAKERELHELAQNALKRDRAVICLADEYGIELTKAEDQELDAYISSEEQAQGGEKGFEDYLSDNYLTRELFKHLCSQKKIEEELRSYMTDAVNNIIPSDDESFEADLKVNFMAVKQILIKNDADDDVEMNRALAEDLFKRISEGESFEGLAREYNEDEESDPRNGRYFTRGMLLDEFEQAVLSVDEGEYYPEVLESSVGFHIILRIPMDSDYIDENYNTLRSYYLNRCFNEKLEEKASQLDFELCDGFDKIDFEKAE